MFENNFAKDETVMGISEDLLRRNSEAYKALAESDETNYFPLRKLFSGLYKYFCYIDTAAYLADNLFINHKVRVHFLQEYVSGNKEWSSEYVFIICKIRRKDEAEFLKALEELKNKMLIMGHRDYKEFCQKFNASKKQFEEDR